jgi:hypothetical protein
MKGACAALVGTAMATILPSSGLAFADTGNCSSGSSANGAAIAVGIGVVGIGVAAATTPGFLFVPAKKGKPVEKKPGDTAISPFVGQNGAPALPSGSTSGQ